MKSLESGLAAHSSPDFMSPHTQCLEYTATETAECCSGSGEALLQREGGDKHSGHGRPLQRVQASGGGQQSGHWAQGGPSLPLSHHATVNVVTSAHIGCGDRGILLRKGCPVLGKPLSASHSLCRLVMHGGVVWCQQVVSNVHL